MPKRDPRSVWSWKPTNVRLKLKAIRWMNANPNHPKLKDPELQKMFAALRAEEWRRDYEKRSARMQAQTGSTGPAK